MDHRQNATDKGESSSRGKFNKTSTPSINFSGVENLRFLLILMIVCNHLGFGQFSEDKSKELGIKIWFEFTSPILAIISGWLFFYNLDNDNYLTKVKKRFYSLVLPYMLWTILYIAVHAVLKQVYLYWNKSPIWTTSIPSWTWSYILEVFWKKPIVGSFWYLQNLILVIPINFIVLRMSRVRWVFPIFYSTLLVLLYLEISIFFSDRFIQYYLAGSYLGLKRFRLNVRFREYPYIMAILLLLSMALELRLRTVQSFHLINIPVILLITFSLLTVLEIYSESRVVQWLNKWSKHSFFIFAGNLIVISLTGKAAVNLLPNDILNSTVGFVFILIAQFVLSVWICGYLSVFTMRVHRGLWGALTGGR